MFGRAATFFIIAISAVLLGFTGIAGIAAKIAGILFVIGVIQAILFAILGRRPRVMSDRTRNIIKHPTQHFPTPPANGI